MLKGINPRDTWDYSIMGAVFTYRAFTGSNASSFTADAYMNKMVDTCVIKIENIELLVRKRNDKGHPIPDKDKDGNFLEDSWELIQFDSGNPFISVNYPEVVLSKVLPSSLCNGLANDIYEVSALKEVESGE